MSQPSPVRRLSLDTVSLDTWAVLLSLGLALLVRFVFPSAGPPWRIAVKAEGMSRAAPHASPEWTPTAE